MRKLHVQTQRYIQRPKLSIKQKPQTPSTVKVNPPKHQRDTQREKITIDVS